jgi:hypothetical protein
MKLGVCYNVFDGIELLEYAIHQIKEHVDYISVVYQEQSWFSHTIPKENLKILKSLEQRKLIDKLVLFDSFKPMKNYSAGNIHKSKKYETAKRNLGLSDCRSENCTHFLCCDVDEFYKPEEFMNAKQYIITNNIHTTAVHFINYVNLPIFRLDHQKIHLKVPFICRIGPKSHHGVKFFCSCDSTRGISLNIQNKKSFIFSKNQILMHHMETIRKNITLKYLATSRRKLKRKKINELVDAINNVNLDNLMFDNKHVICYSSIPQKVTICDNIFNIPYQNW